MVLQRSDTKVILKLDTNLRIIPEGNIFEARGNSYDGPTAETKFKLQLYPDDKEIARFARLVYAGKGEKIEEFLNGSSQLLKEGAKNVFQDWELVAIASNAEQNYFGAAFLREGNGFRHRQIIISHRGTEDLKNWKSNCEGIVNNTPTAVMNSACTFVQEVFKQYKSKSDIPAQMILTGHSLGGWLAQISSFSLKNLELLENGFNRLQEDKCNPHCVTFDSPGALQMLENLNQETQKVAKSLRLDITNYVILPNLVNVINGHLGDLVKIPTECDKQLLTFPVNISLRDLNDNKKHTEETHAIKLFLKLLEVDYEKDKEVEIQTGIFSRFAGSCKRFGKSLVRTVTFQRRRIKYPREFKPLAQPFSKVTKNWPQVRYSVPNNLPEGVSIAGTLWDLFISQAALQGFQAFLCNTETKIVTEHYVKLKVPTAMISTVEETFFKTLMDSQLLKEVENKIVLEKVMKILFPVALPLFEFIHLKRRFLVWPMKKDEHKTTFECEHAFLCFKNIVAWNQSLSRVEIPSNDLWEWVKESVKHYEGLRAVYNLPKFDETSPKLGEEIVIRRPKSELMLLILGLLGERDERIILKFKSKHEPHFEESIKFLRKSVSNAASIIIDFSNSEEAGKRWCEIFNQAGKVRLHFLIPSNCSVKEKKFSIASDSLINVMERKVICDGFQGEKLLSNLVNLESLNFFLESHPDIAIDLLKKEKQIVMDPLMLSVFDSKFTYFQVGTIYSFEELEEYYQKQGESLNKTVAVFIANSNDDLKVLELRESELPKGNHVEVQIVDNISKYFYEFTRICKRNGQNFVDLIRCHIFGKTVKDWRFEQLYQYNPDFYVKRDIVPPALDMTRTLKKLREQCKLDGERLITSVGEERTEFNKINTLPMTGLAINEEKVVAHLSKYITMSDCRRLTLRFDHISSGSLILEILNEKAGHVRDDFKIAATSSLKESEISFSENKFYILSDEPGMGKSTTVLSLLPKLIVEEDHIVVLIELKNIEYLETLKATNYTLESFVNFVSRNKGLKTLSEFLFQQMIGRGCKLTVVFDGYDEMVGKERMLFKQILVHTWEFENVRIIVSTRPNEQDSLQAALCIFSHVFVPIEKKEDKANFLANIWAGILRCKKTDLLPLAETIITQAHAQLLKGRESFLGVPLQLRILAEISLELAANFLENNGNNMEIHKFIEDHKNLAKIYEDFVNRKLELYAQEKLGYVSRNKEEFTSIIKSSIQNSLYWLAGEILDLGEHYAHFTYNCYTSYSDTYEILLKTGIVYGSADNQKLPQFLHKTFAEFYAAKCTVEVVRKIFLNKNGKYESEEFKKSREHFICFALEKLATYSDGNRVIQDFFASMINDDNSVLHSLKNFEINFTTTNHTALNSVKEQLYLFLAVKDPVIAHLIVNGFTSREIKDFVMDLKLHLAFIVDKKFKKVRTALSAILRRFCKEYANVATAPFLCFENFVQPEFPIYFSIQDAVLFFNGPCDLTNPLVGQSVPDFITQWPVLSCLILGRNTHFNIVERLESLCNFDQANEKQFGSVYIMECSPPEDELRIEKDATILNRAIALDIVKDKLEDSGNIPEYWFEESCKNIVDGIYQFL